MMEFKRYSIYYAPRPGAFADRAAAWLGWDLTGQDVAHPDLAGLPLPLADLTRTPRKYGFHGTIKPPFALSPGRDAVGLDRALAGLAATLAPLVCDGLELRAIGGFLALTPRGGEAPMLALGAAVVERLDGFRAALTPEDRARRRPERLSQRQRDLLDRWGYPHVMEEFRFHLTLTGDLEAGVAQAMLPVARDWFAPVLPAPFVVEDLCLCGEAPDGRFHLIRRHALTG